jgi:hypothetical protein
MLLEECGCFSLGVPKLCRFGIQILIKKNVGENLRDNYQFLGRKFIDKNQK